MLASQATPAQPTAIPTSASTSTPLPPANVPDEVQRVTLEQAKTALDSGEAIFVDVRSETSYQLKHIPGALSIPLAALPDRLGELPKDQWIITYCT